MPEFAAPLREQDVDPDPLRQFAAWLDDARHTDLREPGAVAVATSSAEGAPSVRMVLLKQYDERGFVFFTNYGSRKASELAENPRAALLFHWEPLGRQVRIEGPVQRASAQESEAYVRSRARPSQIGALASAQSQVITGRDELERRVKEITERYEGAELPVPDAWGGFRLSPRQYEFWQHRNDRLHDRLAYTRRDDGGWTIQRLAP